MQVHHRSLVERVIHAIGFEVIAVAICAPVGAWLLDRSILQMGTLAVLLSSIAMLWNIVYNSLFDYLARQSGDKNAQDTGIPRAGI